MLLKNANNQYILSVRYIDYTIAVTVLSIDMLTADIDIILLSRATCLPVAG